MSLPGLLIEYLITGAICIAWMIFGFDIDVAKYGNLTLFLIPVAYVLGMVIDNIAFLLTYYLKIFVRLLAKKKHYRKQEKKFDRKEKRSVIVKLVTNYSKLNAEMNMRSSRDRIARGMIVNSLFMTFFLTNYLSMATLVSLLFVSVLSWCIFEFSSHQYFLSVYDLIKKDEAEAAMHDKLREG